MLVTLIAGCGGSASAPVIVKQSGAGGAAPVSRAGAVSGARRGTAPAPSSYVVVQGDTLYAIAWRYALDYRDIARWNRIDPPYVIYPGERLVLNDAPSARAPTQRVHRSQKTGRVSERPAPAAKSSEIASQPSEITWLWPTKGRVIGADTPLGKNGIEIVGELGQAIVAAAPGKVVYSGSGLIGYGKLIIIKHSDTYLSAYAHNDKLLVAEGAQVAGGQKIAEMGNTGAKEVKLHFEIRRNGKPVAPLDYLPRT